MFEMRGKYGTAKIFTDIVDEQSLSQVVNIMKAVHGNSKTRRSLANIYAI